MKKVNGQLKTITVANDILIPEIKRMLDRGHSVTFRVRGNSMRPFLEDQRDNVLLQPCNGDVKRGDVLLVEDRPRHYVMHRVVKVQGEYITLKGDGNVRGTEVCRRSDVIGIATGFQRKGRKDIDSVNALKWRSYSLFWMHTQPLRRMMLALYRRVWLGAFPVKNRITPPVREQGKTIETKTTHTV